MKNPVKALSSFAPFTALDRILERVLDFFDELDVIDLKDHPENLDRTLANLEVLQRRIASALWLFGDTRRAYLLGFPETPEAQQASLEQCAGDMPQRFSAIFTVDDATYQEEERTALCLLQAEVEFRFHLACSFGPKATLISVRPVDEMSQD